MPPEDNQDQQDRKRDASNEKPQSDGGSSSSATEWDGKRLAADKVPADWGDGRPNGKGVGWRWQNPNYKGDGVRVDRGNPDSSYPSQREDHVIVNSRGNVIGLDGQPIDGSIDEDAVNAHIPLQDWLKWSSWNKP